MRVRGWRGQWSEADLVADLGDPTISAFVNRLRELRSGGRLVGVEMRTGISK